MTGAQALRAWTGSSGSSHHPSISPEWALFGLFDFPPSANAFFQLVEVWTTTSFPFDLEPPLLEELLDEVCFF